jgi:RNA recognition motif-containing protein
MNNSPGGLFVGDLSVCFQEGHLRELFQPFGTILKTELRQGFKAHKLLGHGFVTFSTFEEADNAMKHMQGFLVLGRRLR